MLIAKTPPVGTTQSTERAREARIIAHFYDSGARRERTHVAVLSLGDDPGPLQPDQTYLRLRGILNKKREQIPKNSRGVILIEISALARSRKCMFYAQFNDQGYQLGLSFRSTISKSI